MILGFFFFRGKMILGTWAGTCAGFKCKPDIKYSIGLRIVGVCKKLTNRTNLSKLTKLLPNFQFDFGSIWFSFDFLKPKIFGLVFDGRLECTEPNHIIIYFLYNINFINIWVSYTYLGFSFYLKTFGPFFFKYDMALTFHIFNFYFIIILSNYN